MKRLFILTALVFALFAAPTYAENPDFCQYSFESKTAAAKAAVTEELKPAAPAASAIPTYVWVTAYSSAVDETDEDPFTTASMTTVRDGIVAANFLPFGTRIKLPGLTGDKIYVVEDRMHSRKSNYVDVWMPSKAEAMQFGKTKTKIVIVEMPA